MNNGATKRTMRKLFLLIGLLLLVGLACNFPGIYSDLPAAPRNAVPMIVTPDPLATQTPTPFQPLPLTGTPNSPTQGPTAEQTVEQPTLTPTEGGPAAEIEEAEGIVKILLLGSDWRPYSGYRTDVIMLLVLNPSTGAASIVSFPRDLYVFIPGIGQQRINTSQEFGDFDLTVQTFRYNFGVSPDYYVLTNFQGFVGIVDSLGGINVEASRNLNDTCDLPQAVNGYCSAGPGTVTMDGATALWYVRARYSTSDFDRTRRAQEVIMAMFKKMMSLNAVVRAPELYQLYQNSVNTNLPLDVGIRLAAMAPGLLSNPDRIHRYSIGRDEVWPYVTDAGAQVLIPNPEAIQPILYEALHPQ